MKYQLLIEVETDEVYFQSLQLLDHNVIDGWELTRKPKNDEDDITSNFLLKNARIVRSIEDGVEGVYWSVGDFEGQAMQRWENHSDNYPKAEKWQDVYDETKFADALGNMIRKHDANYGISWDTVDFWLDEVCLKEGEK